MNWLLYLLVLCLPHTVQADMFHSKPIEYIVMAESAEIEASSTVFEQSKVWLQRRAGAQAFSGVRDLSVGFRAYETGVLDTATAKQFALEFPGLYIEPNYEAHTMVIERQGEKVRVPLDELKPPGESDEPEPEQPEQKHGWNVKFMGAAKAWAKTQGEGINVAIVDSGGDIDHPDLAAFLECETSVPDTSDCDDDNRHGTHVGGIVAGLDNNIGFVGIAPKARLGMFKALDARGSGKYAWLAEAIERATNSNVKYHIMNHSWGGSSPSELLDRVGKAATEKGIIQVCAAGNNNGAVIWPARYEWCHAIASSFERNGQLAKSGFSAFGPQILMIAPGSGIFSTLPDDKYGPLSGTSMASPAAAGFLALALAAGVSEVVFEDIGLETKFQGWGHPRSDWTLE